MISIIDPNIDPVWESVATIGTKEGIVEKQPRTDTEWAEIKQHALVVREATDLLLIPHRRVAQPGVSTSTSPAELSADEIAQLIANNRPAFDFFAKALHETVEEAIIAIDARDPEALVKAGGRIDQVCEQCHSVFWYPGDKRPN